MEGCKAPITTFIVEPFVPHDQEYYLSIVSDRLGCTISFSECGGIEIEENWDKVLPFFFFLCFFSCFVALSFSTHFCCFLLGNLVFWYQQVKTIFLPAEKSMTLEVCAPLIATLPLEVSFCSPVINFLVSQRHPATICFR